MLVLGQVQLDFGDDAQAAVPSQHCAKQGRFAIAGKLDEAPVRRRQLRGADRAGNRPLANVAAVAIDRHRAAHAEVAVALHDLHRQVMRVQQGLQLPPAHAGLHACDTCDRIQSDQTVHSVEIELQGVRFAGLSAHAEAGASDADGTLPRLQGGHDARRGRGPDDASDTGCLEFRDISGRPLCAVIGSGAGRKQAGSADSECAAQRFPAVHAGQAPPSWYQCHGSYTMPCGLARG